MNKAAVTERLTRFEGSLPHMYLDTAGVVTVGIGHAIESAEEAAGLNWSDPYDLIPEDYARVAGAPTGNYAASYYEDLSTCRMGDEQIACLCASDIDLFEQALQEEFPDWNSYPEPAQEALLDMAYNLGMAGLMKYPRMLAAVDEGDWETAAAESHRNGIPDDRNEEIAGLFLAIEENNG